MPKFNISQCPVCSGEKFKPFITCTDYFVSEEQFDIRECKSCGFKFTVNTEDEKNSGRYYQSEAYISHSNTSKGVVNTLYHLVRNYMLGRKRRLVEKAIGTKKGHILDIGTGTGFFLNEMTKHEWQVSGTEKSTDAREYAQKKFGLKITPPDELFRFAKESFNAITLWHVLEHIHKLNDTMEAFARLLKPEGKLIIALPNPASWDARHYKEFWAAWDVPRHLWHFEPEQMKRLGNKHGLKLTKMVPLPFDSFYVSLLSEKYKKSKPAFLKGVLFGKISWLNSLIHPTQCSSIIYIFNR